MNEKHLGDALDFWKGRVIGLLDRCLNDLCVVPMFTDEDVRAVWKSARLGLYGRLLRVSVSQIRSPQVQFSAATRPTYFQNPDVSNNADLFIDPDIGIAPLKRNDHKHIRLAEIAQLLNGTSRVILIYQHRPQRQVAGNAWLVALLQRLAKGLNGCRPFAYDAGSAAMVFVSHRQSRLDDAREAIQHGLSPEGPELSRIVATDSERPSSQ